MAEETAFGASAKFIEFPPGACGILQKLPVKTKYILKKRERRMRQRKRERNRERERKREREREKERERERDREREA